MTCRPTAAMQRGASMAQRERSLTASPLIQRLEAGSVRYPSAVMTIRANVCPQYSSFYCRSQTVKLSAVKLEDFKPPLVVGCRKADEAPDHKNPFYKQMFIIFLLLLFYWVTVWFSVSMLCLMVNEGTPLAT